MSDLWKISGVASWTIANHPNEWSDDPRYIIGLVKRIVRVSVETNRIVPNLPALNERDVEINSRQSALWLISTLDCIRPRFKCRLTFSFRCGQECQQCRSRLLSGIMPREFLVQHG